MLFMPIVLPFSVVAGRENVVEEAIIIFLVFICIITQLAHTVIILYLIVILFPHTII